MTLRPGSLIWLVLHDMRLSWRGFSATLGAVGGRYALAIALVTAIVLHAVAVPLSGWLSPMLMDETAKRPVVAAVLTCTFTWLLAQSLFGAARTLYVRGDLDLLLGSPLPPHRIIAAKAIGLATGCIGSLAFICLPIANAGAAYQSLSWLSVYPLLLSFALAASALGLSLAIALFGLLGARRARLWTQMTGAFIAGAFVLGAQIVAMLPSARRQGVSDWFASHIHADAQGPLSLMRLPIDAFHGDPVALAVLLTFGLTAFASANLFLGRRFADLSLIAAGSGSAPESAADRDRPIRFREGLERNMWRKEWRLLARDPGMFAQLALQIIYTVPVAVVLLRNESLPAVFALSPTIVVIAAQISASLAWLTVSGEDAPELIATAPVHGGTVDRAKLQSVALPVLLVLTLPLFALSMVSLQGAVLTFAAAIAAAISTALLNFWHPMPGSRRGMLRRHSQSKLVGLLEHGLALLWALVIVMALIGSKLAVVPVMIVGGVLLAMRRGARSAHA